MNTTAGTVSIHPYFKVHGGKMEAARALLPKFVAQTAQEDGVLGYEFTIEGDISFCRESYTDAEAALAHLGNVRLLLDELLRVVDLMRLEIHGPASELDKLKQPLSHLKPAWFVLECSLRR